MCLLRHLALSTRIIKMRVRYDGENYKGGKEQVRAEIASIMIREHNSRRSMCPIIAYPRYKESRHRSLGFRFSLYDVVIRSCVTLLFFVKPYSYKESKFTNTGDTGLSAE